MRQTLNVFYSIGRYFIPYFSVSLTSLLETNKHLNLNIFLIYDFDDKSLLKEVINFAKEKYGININLIFQDSSSFQNYRISAHVSINTYLRLLLSDIIPDHVDSGLFLDSDTVVTGSLHELANLKFADIDDNTKPESSKYIYAVREISIQSEINSKRISSLGYKTDKYFNGGVLMVNLKNWRAEKISGKLMEMVAKYMDDLVFWDQDVLNMFFANKWGELDGTYNAIHLQWKRPKTPLVIHYAGGSKPWNYLDRHPYKSHYFKYLALTPFKKNKYVDFSFNKMPYKHYRDFRRSLNYLRQLSLGNIKRYDGLK